MTAPFQPVPVQRPAVIGDGASLRRRGGGVSGIFTHDYLKHFHGVFHGAGDRPGDIGAHIQRKDAGAAGEPHRGTDAGERLMRRRSADGIAGIAAEADESETGRDGCRRSAARPGRHAIQRVGIFRVPGQNRTDRLHGAERPLRHVGFRQYNRTGSLDARHLSGIFLRKVTGES